MKNKLSFHWRFPLFKQECTGIMHAVDHGHQDPDSLQSALPFFSPYRLSEGLSSLLRFDLIYLDKDKLILATDWLLLNKLTKEPLLLELDNSLPAGNLHQNEASAIFQMIGLNDPYLATSVLTVSIEAINS